MAETTYQWARGTMSYKKGDSRMKRHPRGTFYNQRNDILGTH